MPERILLNDNGNMLSNTFIFSLLYYLGKLEYNNLNNNTNLIVIIYIYNYN